MAGLPCWSHRQRETCRLAGEGVRDGRGSAAPRHGVLANEHREYRRCMCPGRPRARARLGSGLEGRSRTGSRVLARCMGRVPRWGARRRVRPSQPVEVTSRAAFRERPRIAGTAGSVRFASRLSRTHGPGERCRHRAGMGYPPGRPGGPGRFGSGPRPPGIPAAWPRGERVGELSSSSGLLLNAATTLLGSPPMLATTWA